MARKVPAFVQLFYMRLQSNGQQTRRSETIMQPHDSDQCPAQGDSDGGRDDERCANVYEALMAISQALDVANGKVRVAEPGKPLNLFANISGKGGLTA